MSRYIDAESHDAIEITTKIFAPTVDAVKVKHGEWLVNQNGFYFCSQCNEQAYWRYDRREQIKSRHCPFCGAKMECEE